LVSAAVIATTATAAVDYRDVQAIVRFGHGQLIRACFYAVRIRNLAAARLWLRQAPVTAAVAQKPVPVSALQVAFTADGMKALGVPDALVASFSPEFVSGMAGDAARTRRLGDFGTSAPSQWRWGADKRIPHLLVMLFATADAWPATEAATLDSRWNEAFESIADLRAADLDRNEPFGFADGLSQPEIDWEQSRVIRKDETEYTNLSTLGEFVLGYRNEYGRFTERPLLDRADGVDLPAALDAPHKLDLGRHGTYLVIRDLRQDVRGFWRYMHAQTGSRVEASRLAEAMMGRTMNGEPLVQCGGRSIQGIARTPENERLNHFLFSDDVNGERCPLGAHIRRANPRNSDFGGPAGGPISRLMHSLGFAAKGWRDDRVGSTRFHRILRRGRKFGPTLTREQALQPPPSDDPERGIYFACLNANIARQFEFIQNAWLMGAGFEGLSRERDPVLGTRSGDAQMAPCSTFTIPTAGGASRRLYDLPEFVTLRGGAYFFLPGVRALRYLATVGGQASGTSGG
jgi:deferrochelatase/peroxidase EfeB